MRSRRLPPGAPSRGARSVRGRRSRAASAWSTGRSPCSGSSSSRGSGRGGCARSTSARSAALSRDPVPLAYLTTVLPSFYWFFVGRMRRPVHMEPAPDRPRVALITLCVPSHETLDVIAAQLRALTRGALPARQLGAGRGGRSRRRGARRRSSASATSRARASRAGTSPGRPSRPRRRPATSTPGWTTSGCRASTTTSSSSSTSTTGRSPSTSTAPWATSTIRRWPGCRRRACAATSTAGPRAGWPSRTWCCRARCRWASTATAARRSSSARTRPTGRRPSAAIGGFQPTRAEDHLDTVVLAAAGYTGVFVPEIIAEGDGPRGLRDLPRPAVRVGVFDGPDPPASHPAPRAALQLRARPSSS